MAQMTQAFPDRSFSGIGGVSDFNQALSYILLGCGTVQVCTAAMLDQAVGPNVIKRLIAGLDAFLGAERRAGWSRVEDFRGLRRDRIVSQSDIRRPEAADYHSGYEVAEGYAGAEPVTPASPLLARDHRLDPAVRLFGRHEDLVRVLQAERGEIHQQVVAVRQDQADLGRSRRSGPAPPRPSRRACAAPRPTRAGQTSRSGPRGPRSRRRRSRAGGASTCQRASTSVARIRSSVSLSVV